MSYVYRRGRNIIEDRCFDQAACPGVFWLTNASNGDKNLLRSGYHGTVVSIQSRLTERDPRHRRRHEQGEP
ncbi:MAG: hypothetical protein LC796_00165 [Acidobacteria bacterium]|nr:hypothetical protein [Acidobacteriota bacterium]MCA1609978.1 hypothetical protein [Acidobacteriota bacterium]